MAHWCEIQGSETVSDTKLGEGLAAMQSRRHALLAPRAGFRQRNTQRDPACFPSRRRKTNLWWHRYFRPHKLPTCVAPAVHYPNYGVTEATLGKGRQEGRLLLRLLITAAEHGAGRFISTGEEGEVNQSLCSRFSFNSFLIISTASSGKNETGLKKMMSLRKHLTNFSSDEDLI